MTSVASNRRVMRGLLRRQPPAGAGNILRRGVDVFFEAHQFPVAGRRHEGISGFAGRADHGVVGPQRVAENMFGDTLRSNDAMIAVARRAGYSFVPTPGDWKLVRFEKHIAVAPKDIPCASWRLAAEQMAQHATA